jgi:hypothetical protein
MQGEDGVSAPRREIDEAPCAGRRLRAHVRSAELSLVERADFVREDFVGTDELAQVSQLADALFEHLSTSAIAALIFGANQPGRSSAGVQAVLLAKAKQLGFRDESKGLFREYSSSALRPDYYMSLGDTGVILEVERGKTTINNMDLLDFWKCHICAHANYLFLLVPTELRENSTMGARKEFATVKRRLATFFEPRNYTNVRGLFLFGY